MGHWLDGSAQIACVGAAKQLFGGAGRGVPC